MTKKIEVAPQKQIDRIAESLARILIQQVMNNKNLVAPQKIETKYGNRNR